ncbi:hypothetical protein D1403_004273 [Escherichia albertii]|nr:hypothetical protein [Escherichia albertii]
MQYAKDRGFWCSFTVTRQQSLAAMQAAARKVKGADVAAGAGLPERFRRSAILAEIWRR